MGGIEWALKFYIAERGGAADSGSEPRRHSRGRTAILSDSAGELLVT